MTTIRVSEDTVKRLKKLGKMGDSYEDVIQVLLSYYEEKGGEKKEDD